MEQCPTEITKLCSLHFHVISSNATKYATKLDKKVHKSKQKPQFGENVRDYKDGSGLQFINFDFVTGGQEIKVPILLKF